MARNEPRLKLNDKVIIKDKTHKWYGEKGRLTEEEMKPFPGMFRVELDNGFAAGCYLNQLEKL